MRVIDGAGGQSPAIDHAGSTLRWHSCLNEWTIKQPELAVFNMHGDAKSAICADGSRSIASPCDMIKVGVSQPEDKRSEDQSNFLAAVQHILAMFDARSLEMPTKGMVALAWRELGV